MSNRIEVITGTERRRSHPEEFKLKLVHLALEPGANSSAIARQHGISPSLLFKWKKDYAAGASPSHAKPNGEALAPLTTGFARVKPAQPEAQSSGEIFIHVGDDIIIELPKNTSACAIAAYVHALRGSRCDR